MEINAEDLSTKLCPWDSSLFWVFLWMLTPVIAAFFFYSIEAYSPCGPYEEMLENKAAFEEKVKKESVLLKKGNFFIFNGVAYLNKESLPKEMQDLTEDLPVLREKYVALKDLQEAAYYKEGGVFFGKEETFDSLTKSESFGYWNPHIFGKDGKMVVSRTIFGLQARKEIPYRSLDFYMNQMVSSDVLYLRNLEEVLVPHYGRNRRLFLKEREDFPKEALEKESASLYTEGKSKGGL